MSAMLAYDSASALLVSIWRNCSKRTNSENVLFLNVIAVDFEGRGFKKRMAADKGRFQEKERTCSITQ